MSDTYDCIVTWQEDDLTEITMKHNWDTIDEAEDWIFATMVKAVKDNPNIENVSADWERHSMGMGKTFEINVGF